MEVPGNCHGPRPIFSVPLPRCGPPDGRPEVPSRAALPERQDAGARLLQCLGPEGDDGLQHDMETHGDGSIPINTIFSGMNIHKSQLF